MSIRDTYVWPSRRKYTDVRLYCKSGKWWRKGPIQYNCSNDSSTHYAISGCYRLTKKHSAQWSIDCEENVFYFPGALKHCCSFQVSKVMDGVHSLNIGIIRVVSLPLNNAVRINGYGGIMAPCCIFFHNTQLRHLLIRCPYYIPSWVHSRHPSWLSSHSSNESRIA